MFANSLQRRLAMTLGAIVAVVVVALLTFNFLQADSVIEASVDDRLENQADLLELSRGRGGRGDGLRGLNPRGSDADRRDFDNFGDRNFRLALLTRTGEQFGANIPIDDERLDRILATGRQEFHTQDLDDVRFRILSRPLNNDDVLLIAREVTSNNEAVRQLGRRLLLTGLLGVLSAGLLGWFVARRVTSPITRVAAAANHLAHAQDLPSRIEVDRTDEVGQLATSFNEMLTALEVSREQQARLVSDASHELRTPLTSLRMKIDFLRSQPDLPDEQRSEVVSGAAIELESLTELVTELVDLASNSSIDEEPVSLDLRELANDAARRARITSGRTITVDSRGTIVTARPKMVRRALSNLIENAIKYSPEAATIELVERDGAIEVRDHGPGIDEADRALAFDRFFRADGAQTKPGSGIGLAIVKRCAQVHGGDVWITETPGGGATVGFSLR